MSLLLVAFLGLSPLLFGGLFALSALVVTSLYLLDSRLERTKVPFIKLFPQREKDSTLARARTRMRRWLSWALQMLLALLLLLALLEPSLDDAESQTERLIVVVDTSGSMGQVALGTTRLQKAIHQTEHLVSALPRDRKVVVAEAASGVSVVVPEVEVRHFSADLMSEMRPRDSAFDELRFEDWLGSVAADEGTQVILLTDAEREVLSKDPRVDVRPFAPGAPAEEVPPNLAITTFAARRHPVDVQRVDAVVEIKNWAESKATFELELESGAVEVNSDSTTGALLSPQTLDVRTVELEAGESRRLFFEQLRGSEPGLVARIHAASEMDAFVQDSVARATVPAIRPLKVGRIGKESEYLQAALRLGALWDDTPINSLAALDDSFDVLIAASTALEMDALPSGLPVLLLGPPAESNQAWPLKREKSISMVGFDNWKEDSSVFRAIDPYRAQSLWASALSPGPDDQVLGSSEKGALLVGGVREGHEFLALGFTPEASDLVLRPAWPLLIRNLLLKLVPTRLVGEATSLTSAVEVELSLEPNERAKGSVLLRGPLGASFLPAVGESVSFRPEHSGFWLIGEGAAERPIAVNFAPVNESSGFDLDEVELKIAQARRQRWQARLWERLREWEHPWWWLVALAGLLLVVEWVTFHRRWTT